MGTRLLLSLALTGLLPGGPADAGVIIAVDEHGDGVGTLGGGFLAPDPGPGGLPAVLTYRLPFAGTVGDVYLTEPVQVFSDVIRFNGTGTLVFYSSSADGFDSLADTLGPPAISYANFALIPEVGTGNNHVATYTPRPGQPGYDPVAQPTYNFVSDGFVAEPSSVVMGGTAALLGLGFWWRRRRRAATRGPAGGRCPRQDARGVVNRSKWPAAWAKRRRHSGGWRCGRSSPGRKCRARSKTRSIGKSASRALDRTTQEMTRQSAAEPVLAACKSHLPLSEGGER